MTILVLELRAVHSAGAVVSISRRLDSTGDMERFNHLDGGYDLGKGFSSSLRESQKKKHVCREKRNLVSESMMS